MLDDFFYMNFELRVHFFGIHPCFPRHLLNDVYDLSEDLRSALFHECHQIFYFLFFRLVDHHLVSLVHEKVQLFGQLVMIEKSMIDFYEAVILIFCLLVLSQELCNILIGLKILTFQFFKPFFGLFDTDLFHQEKWFKL